MLQLCRMEGWDGYRYFLAVVRQGSISAAAETLRVNHTTVSRRIASLEAQLDTRLFERRKTGFVPTPAAAQLIAAAEQMEAGANHISRLSLAQDVRLEGPLRVTAPLAILHYVLVPALADFVRDHPRIELSVQGSDEITSLVNCEADVAVRVTSAPMETLHGYRICDSVSALYVAPAFLLKHGIEAGTAMSKDDLDWISQDEEVTRTSWHKRLFSRGRLVCRADNKLTAIDAAVQGLGVVELPKLIGRREPRLVQIPDYEIKSDKSIWLLYHRDLRNSARVRAFVDAIRAARIG